jgi:predicted anti-sigma-YlaC factor YlaD
MSADEIVCREFAELATDYLESAMPEPMLELVEEHLAMCDWCRDYLRQVRATVDAVAAEAAAAQPAPPAPTLDELIGAFRRQTKGGRAP